MDSPRLSPVLLPDLSIAKPKYDRSQVKHRHLHIGVGGFHRAHQATYSDDLLGDDPSWGIIGASLKSATAAEQLNPQAGLFTLATRSPTATHYRVVGSISSVLDPSSVAVTLADPNTQLVTITTTEKSYFVKEGRLDIEHADIQADLKNERPQTLLGHLAAGLALRRKQNAGPITLISCDNLSGNGDALHQVLVDYADLWDSELSTWIAREVAFPNTMVDRIVPKTTAQDHAQLAEDLGYLDPALVVCEPWRQWVIEDKFATPRPAWENVGVQITNDVSAFEQAKLQLLNGPHSASAYLGILSGYEYVHEVMQDDNLARFLRQLVSTEIIPATKCPKGMNPQDYSQEVFTRFSNPQIAYGTRQVGSDGSQKLPQRLIPVLKSRLAEGASSQLIFLVLGAWVEHLQDPAPDPQAAELKSLFQSHQSPSDLVQRIVTDTEIFADLNEYRDQLIEGVSQAAQTIRQEGVATAVGRLVNG